MNCPLGRLQIAVDAAVKRSSDEMKFQAQLHGAKIKEDLKPIRTAKEQVQRAKAAFASLGTTKVTR